MEQLTQNLEEEEQTLNVLKALASEYNVEDLAEGEDEQEEEETETEPAPAGRRWR